MNDYGETVDEELPHQFGLYTCWNWLLELMAELLSKPVQNFVHWQYGRGGWWLMMMTGGGGEDDSDAFCNDDETKIR